LNSGRSDSASWLTEAEMIKQSDRSCKDRVEKGGRYQSHICMHACIIFDD
jgi:hypothetical protein